MPIRLHQAAVSLICCGAIVAAIAGRACGAVDFEHEIQPIIESACLHCHNAAKAEGGLQLDSLAAAVKGGDNETALVPGSPAKSPFYARLILPAGHDQIMPPDRAPLDELQTSRIRAWIEEGANWPKTAKLVIHPRIDFVNNVQPILEMNCLSCHSGKKPKGDFNLTTRELALASGSDPPAIKPFHPEASALYKLTTVAKGDSTLMPPVKEGGPLTKEEIEILRLWISQGADWPNDVTLKTRPKSPIDDPNPDDLALVQKIRDMIVERTKAEGDGKLADYSAKIPQTGIPYSMVAIKGGEFLMGSPASEPGHQENEGPQTKVQVSSFWLGKYEVSWDEFEPFMITRFERYKNGARKDYDPKSHSLVDAVSGPTRPYADMTFGMGKLGLSSDLHDATRGQQILRMAERPNRPFLSSSDRGGMGVRLPGWHHNRLFVRRKSQRPERLRLERRQQR